MKYILFLLFVLLVACQSPIIETVEDCSKLSRKDRSNCYYTFAIIEEDPELCQKATTRPQCARDVEKVQQYTETDCSGKDSWDKEECLIEPLRIAHKEGRELSDFSCDTLETDRYKAYCKVHETPEYKSCEGVTTHDYSLCKIEVAVVNNEPQTCPRFGIRYAEQCLERVFKYNNPTSCEEVNDPLNSRVNELCLSHLAAAKNDVTICETLTEKDKEKTLGVEILKTMKGYCYGQVAIKQKDSSICDSTQKTTRDNCFREFALDTMDISMCNKIQNTKERMFCVQRFVDDVTYGKVRG